MSDRIAVMRNGTFVQIGTPSEIYDSPRSVYVARFVGEANILPCTYVRDIDTDTSLVDFCGVELVVRKGSCGKLHGSGDLVHVALRGEKAIISEGSAKNRAGVISGIVSEISFAGGVMRITCDCGGTKLTAVRYGLDSSVNRGDTVTLEIPEKAAVLCDGDEEGDV